MLYFVAMRFIVFPLLLAVSCAPIVESLDDESESEPCDERACGIEFPPIGEMPDAEPDPVAPSCRDFVAEVEMEAGELATIEVACPVGAATYGTCVPDGTGLIAAGFLVEGDEFVGYACEVRNDSDLLRVQRAEVTCCDGPV